MQFILTQQEMDILKEAAERKDIIDKGKLQEFCIYVANNMPVKNSNIEGGDETYKQPWTCLITSKIEWYCDNCPCLEVCPHDEKEFSK